MTQLQRKMISVGFPENEKYPIYQDKFLDSLTKEIAQDYMFSFIKDQQAPRFPTKEKDLAFIKNKQVLRSQLPCS
jgi:hypothetical protein